MVITDPAIRDLLTASGWFASRRVDTTFWIEQLQLAGYEMNEISRQVLASLGGLTIQPVCPELQVYSASPVRLDPILLKWLPRPRPWEKQLGTVLSPLGECFDDSSLYIGEDGRLYANWDAMLQCLGSSFEDSLATLLLAKQQGTRIKLDVHS